MSGLGPAGDVVTAPVPLSHNRDFQLLWSGQVVSVAGSQISKIAYPLLVLAITGSPAKAGIAGFAAMLGYLLLPLPTGALADRVDRNCRLRPRWRRCRREWRPSRWPPPRPPRSAGPTAS